MKNLEKGLERLLMNYSNISKSVQTMSDTLKSGHEQIEYTSNAIGKLNTALASLKDKGKDVGSILQVFTKEIDNLKKEVDKLV